MGISCVTTACVYRTGSGKKVKLSFELNGSEWSAACTDHFAPRTRALNMRRRLGRPEGVSEHFIEGKILYSLPGIEPFFLLSSSL
jgi:hypothetical protein